MLQWGFRSYSFEPSPLLVFGESLKKEETSFQLTSKCIGTSVPWEKHVLKVPEPDTIIKKSREGAWYLNCKIILPCNNRMFPSLPSIFHLFHDLHPVLLLLQGRKTTTNKREHYRNRFFPFPRPFFPVTKNDGLFGFCLIWQQLLQGRP